MGLWMLALLSLLISSAWGADSKLRISYSGQCEKTEDKNAYPSTREDCEEVCFRPQSAREKLVPNPISNARCFAVPRKESLAFRDTRAAAILRSLSDERQIAQVYETARSAKNLKQFAEQTVEKYGAGACNNLKAEYSEAEATYRAAKTKYDQDFTRLSCTGSPAAANPGAKSAD